MWAGSTRGPQAPPGRYQVKLTADGVDEDPGLHDQPQRGGPDRDRRRSAGAVQARQAINDKVTAANEAVLRIRSLKTRSPTAARQDARRHDQVRGPKRSTRQADRGRRGDLSVPEPQQPGPAELSDPVEQQACGAAGHRGERRLQTDGSVLRGVQGASARLDEQLAQLDRLAVTELAALNQCS